MQELQQISKKFQKIVKSAQGTFQGGIDETKGMTQMSEEMTQNCQKLFKLMEELQEIKLTGQGEKARKALYSSIECVRESFLIDTSTIFYPEPSMLNLSNEYILKGMEYSLEYEEIMEKENGKQNAV
jgi:hypothetical protein